ncbi:ABC transporter [Coccidioides immitis RS]|uniref:ABC transporter n=1 Tax=Coccidioides immitis (strain RS) TaxID=246410 RepID=J3K8J2_COCIM|nr:ABC transporter [Coccidioides immitis RS]EAS31144.3 ABC transporter [Coccidioides immitis RS]
MPGSGSGDPPPQTREPTDSSDAETLFTSSDYEARRENLRNENPQGLTRPTSGVDVQRAEEEFAQLSKQLTGISERAKRLSRQQSNRLDEKTPEDIETSTEGEPFDLETTLRGSRTAEADAGIRPKRIGVIWDGLTVRGIGGVRNIVRTFPNAVVDFFNVPQTIMHILGLGRKGKEFEILKNFKGVAKPGEMVLVLGKPSAGCTTFLKVIANQRFGYTGVDGEVRYGPFDASAFAKRFRGEAVYNQEDDVHHPTLTVGQTLGFALDTKTPGKRPAGMSKAEFKEKIINLLLKMFNIEHTINTVVGNQFVRGVSGGERKRVSIAEMMVTSATVLAWDNTTRGLDASTALDYAKSLRILTNIYQTTTFVSLYQASENIYDQFNKVMVIDSGRQVYFGPTKEARAYFEDLGFKEKPRQTTPDYLTGCTDPFEREYKEGRNAENTPSTPDALVQAFEKSRFNEALEQEMDTYRAQLDQEKHVYDDFEMAHLEAKRKFTSKSSVYSIPFYLQVWALMQRQFLIKWQDKFSLAVSWITSIGVAIVLGTVWLKLPTTSAGAFTRGGVLFISLLFNALQAFSELASTMLGRPIVNKHRAYTFHRPSALWIAQIAVDLAFASVQIFVFSVIVYFMCGLVLDAGAFFTFVLIIITGYLSMTLFFRTVGCVCPDFDYALKGVSIIITLFVVTSGYLIQWQDQQVWLRWFFYINAVGLGFSGLMMNEFGRLNMTCTPESLIPAGPGYTNLSHQVCTLPGGDPGSSIIPGSNYIKLQFRYDPADLWRNWGIMVVLIVVFLCANAYLGEALTYGAGGKTVTFFAKETHELKKLNSELQEKKRNRQEKKSEESESNLKIESKSVLSWEDLCYDVPVPGGTRRLLNNVFGYVEPGKLTALMGASGAGKTTLLDVLAARKNIGVITGDILVDGRTPGSSFQRGTSYAEQLDVHEPTQTVREALRFSATLRQPYEVPEEEKFAYVEEIISLLELENLADAIIGDPETGLSVEERKRVTIGVELAAKPQLLLFLDEPTSGLDSQSAFNIVRFLRKLAAAGQAILCTIHQPNSALFENFDRLLLLQRGGECVYFGDIGTDARILRDYFHRNGADCPSNANPAEWMLDAIGAGQTPRIGSRDWGDVWETSPEFEQVKQRIVEIKDERVKATEGASASADAEKEYATPLWHQIKVVCRRTNLAFWRSPNYGFTRLFSHVALALITGLCYLQLNDSRSSLQYRIFVLFQITVIPALILAQVEPKYDMSRLIFYRESAAKAYKQFPFALSMVLAEVPYSILCAVCFFLPLYYIPGLQSASSRAGYQFFMILITEFFAVTLGQTISALTPSTFIAMLLNPPVIIIFFLFCGVSIPRPQIPKFWRVWLYELDPFTRLMSGMIVTELHDRPVTCKPEELNRFVPPPGQDCFSYMKEFFANGGPGYLVKNATDICEYCAYKVGDQFYKPFGMEFSNRWRDLGIFLCFIASNLILLFVGSRYLNFNRR